jgi:hypothetical protein
MIGLLCDQDKKCDLVLLFEMMLLIVLDLIQFHVLYVHQVVDLFRFKLITLLVITTVLMQME